MAKRVQIVGTTTAGTAAFVGLVREVTVDTDRVELAIHTGGGANTHKRIPNKDSNDLLYQTISTLLTNMAALSATGGLVAKTGANTLAARTLTGTANQLAVTNGDGAAANPTISLPAAITLPGSLTLGGAVTGGTNSFTGGIFTSAKATINALGAISGSNNVDLALGNVITCTQNSANLTLVFGTNGSYAASGTYQCWYVIVTLDATPHTLTLQRSAGNSVTYDTNGAPVLTASKIICIVLETTDGGTTVRASTIGQF